MALALGIKSGSLIQVGLDLLKVLSVKGTTVEIQLEREKGVGLTVSDKERQQVFPDVWVSSAKSKRNDGQTRLVFEAPLSIQISRLN